jgi:hypothetical protein
MRRTSISTSSSRHAAARQVDRAVAGALGQQRMVGVDRAHDLQRVFFLYGQAEFCACGLLGHGLAFLMHW